MKKETTIWTAVLLIGVVLLVIKAMYFGGLGRAYVQKVPQTFVQIVRPVPDVVVPGCGTDIEKVWVPEEFAAGAKHTGAQPISWTRYDNVFPREFFEHKEGVELSVSRTIGLWVGAFLTLCLFSFLYRDNVFYKLAESIFIGISAAYWMVVGFWNVIVPNLFGKLAPGMVPNWAMPGLEDTEPHWVYLIPLLLGVMLLWRLMPKGSWIARWPLGLFIGVFAGLRMTQFIQADFINQIGNGIYPFVAYNDNGFSLGTSIKNTIAVLGVLACLTYFFFSFEHKGAIGKVARLGTWILMITFGAMFGYTVMGRIVLLTGRFEFLFDDWLWLIDPTGRRAITAAATAAGLI